MPDRRCCRRIAAAVITALAVGLVPAAQGKVLHSPDDLAPPDAPAHWLPPEPWIYNHWLPYDERRLYRLLHITRDDLWQQLRNDHHTLAQLAARHGWRSPQRLAAALVAPRNAGAVGRAELEQRAIRTITQGHLAQHLFFHSLHQFAIPSAAPDIFGVTDAAFRNLRRQELSPLAIGRLHGRSPGRIEGAAIAVLRERLRAGTTGGDISAAQARILLRRQLTQLPRWLDQARYNGPPLTHRGALVLKPRDYASNPAISHDGRYVAYEAYRQKLPVAVKLGEIAVLRADLDGGATDLISAVAPGGRDGADPISAYNPSISGDGAYVTYESSRGNQNFAKRYGRIGTLLCDLTHASTDVVDRPDVRTSESLSSYNPSVAAGGGRMIYEAVQGGRTVIVARDLPSGRERVVVAGARAGGARYADPYEPGISADGTRVVYTLASGRLGAPSTARSTVRVLDLRSGRTTVISRAGALAANPGMSADGRFVAYTAAAGAGQALLLRDVDGGTTVRLPAGSARPLDPAVSDRGAVVAYSSARGATSSIMAYTSATRTVSLVSRASGPAGGPGHGWSETPSISGDGRRIAFASDAPDLDPARRDGTRAIFVRDLAAGTTRAVSDVAAAYTGRPVTGATATAAAAPAGATVSIIDNAFQRGVQRPVVRVRAGATVRWRWQSRQSHGVLVREGPERFASAIRNHGSFAHRFSRPGTYRIVCPLHAPGMLMTVRVR
jgi:Tol biopolymer transport system component